MTVFLDLGRDGSPEIEQLLLMSQFGEASALVDIAASDNLSVDAARSSIQHVTIKQVDADPQMNGTADIATAARQKRAFWYGACSEGQLVQEAIRLNIDPDAALAHARREAAAIALDADLHVTSPPELRPPTYRVGRSTVDVASALRILGLHQRRAGYLRVTSMFTVGVDLVEMGKAWDLLHPVWRVVIGASGGSAPWSSMLRQSIFRLGQALRARDELLAQSMQTNASGGSNDPATLLERCAIALSACFDVVARAVRLAQPIAVAPHQAGWNRQDFQRRVTALNARLESVLGSAQNSNVRRVVGHLRNTVHHDPLNNIGTSNRNRESVMVAIPDDIADEFLESCQSIGVANTWVHHHSEHSLIVEPTEVVDQLVELVAEQICALVDAIDWPDQPEQPPAWPDDRRGAFGAFSTRTIEAVRMTY